MVAERRRPYSSDVSQFLGLAGQAGERIDHGIPDLGIGAVLGERGRFP